MAKKKDKPRVINNIQELNLEIDYDKLAEAIVKATDAENNKYSFSREWMKFVITPMFGILSLVSGITSIGFFLEMIVNIVALSKNYLDSIRWITIISSFTLSIFLFGICIMSIASIQEIKKENNKQYIATIFSNITALVALIVALVSLFKGVG